MSWVCVGECVMGVFVMGVFVWQAVCLSVVISAYVLA